MASLGARQKSLSGALSAREGDYPLSRVASELEVIFGESGSKVLLGEISNTHGVSLADAIRRPAEFQQALTWLLGDLGSYLVMQRIQSRVRGPNRPDNC